MANYAFISPFNTWQIKTFYVSNFPFNVSNLSLKYLRLTHLKQTLLLLPLIVYLALRQNGSAGSNSVISHIRNMPILHIT